MIWGVVLKFLGGFLTDGLKAWLEYKQEMAKSANEQRRIDSNERVETIKAGLHERAIAKKAMATVLIAEQSHFWNWIIRPLFAVPTGIYYAKIIIWDKLLQLGSTLALTGQVAAWADAIVYSYFFVEGSMLTARIIGNRFGNKTPAPVVHAMPVTSARSPTDASQHGPKGQ